MRKSSKLMVIMAFISTLWLYLDDFCIILDDCAISFCQNVITLHSIAELSDLE